jgi:hypothetical protein
MTEGSISKIESTLPYNSSPSKTAIILSSASPLSISLNPPIGFAFNKIFHLGI